MLRAMTFQEKLCASGLHDITDPDAVFMHKGKRRCRLCHRDRMRAAYTKRRQAREKLGLKSGHDQGMTVAETDAFLEREERRRMLMPWERLAMRGGSAQEAP